MRNINCELPNEPIALELFKAGKYNEALYSFLKLASQEINNHWYHYHIGRCYAALGAIDLCEIHLLTALEGINDYKIRVELARCYSESGRNDALFNFFNCSIHDKRFVANATQYLCSSSDFKRVTKFFNKNINIFGSVLQHNNQWLRFFKTRSKVMLKFFDDTSVEGRLKISFSKRMPFILNLIDDETLKYILLLSMNCRLHFEYASWDFCSKISDFTSRTSLLVGLPQWLRREIQQDPVSIIFDAAEESPLFTKQDIVSYRRRLRSNEGSNLTLGLITANSLHPDVGDTINIVEFNIYPLLVTRNALNNPDSNHQYSSERRNCQTKFSIMNGMPRAHRIATMILIRRLGMLNYISYSWWGSENAKLNNLNKYIRHVKGERFNLLEIKTEEIEWIKSLQTKVVDTNDGNTHYLCDTTPLPFLRASEFHLVSETEFGKKDVFRITEKTMKPIIAGVPFLVIGSPGVITYLRDLGFDVLDDYINHSYDKEKNDCMRLLKVVDQMKRLLHVTVPNNRLSEMFETNLAKLMEWYTTEFNHSKKQILQMVNKGKLNYLSRRHKQNYRVAQVAHGYKLVNFIITNTKDVIQKEYDSGRYYGVEELNMIGEHLRPDSVVIDIGSNVGNHSVFISKHLAPKKVIPLECSPDAIELLVSNIIINGLCDVIDMSYLGVAIGSDRGRGGMTFPQKNKLGAGRVNSNLKDEFTIYPGSDLFTDLHQVDFIKIDTKWLEISVIKGLQNIINRCRPTMFVEVGKKNEIWFDKLMSKIGYFKVDSFKRYKTMTNYLVKPIE